MIACSWQDHLEMQHGAMHIIQDSLPPLDASMPPPYVSNSVQHWNELQTAHFIKGIGSSHVWEQYSTMLLAKTCFDGVTLLAQTKEDLITLGFQPMHASVVMNAISSITVVLTFFDGMRIKDNTAYMYTIYINRCLYMYLSQ